jgi:hypothetical protein
MSPLRRFRAHVRNDTVNTASRLLRDLSLETSPGAGGAVYRCVETCNTAHHAASRCTRVAASPGGGWNLVRLRAMAKQRSLASPQSGSTNRPRDRSSDARSRRNRVSAHLPRPDSGFSVVQQLSGPALRTPLDDFCSRQRRLILFSLGYLHL